MVSHDDAGVRLDKLLARDRRIGSRGRALTALQRGKVFVNDDEVTPLDAARRLGAGDRVRVWMDRPGSARKRWSGAGAPGELQIVYEDDALVVVNKPAGLLTVPLPRQGDTPSVKKLLTAHFRPRGKRPAMTVHRIDRDTSGLVVFSMNGEAQKRLKDQFRRHEVERVYLAVVYGHPDPPSGTWRDHVVWDERALIQKETHARDPRAREAVSRYATARLLHGAALVEIRLETGKRNQIRLQARLRGHTLVGEQRYVFGPETLRAIDFPRQALHAHRLAFRHPLTGESLRFEAPLPPDMVELIDRLQ